MPDRGLRPCPKCGLKVVTTGDGRFPCAWCGTPLPPGEEVVVSEFEWLSLEHSVLTGAPHPLDELLEGRRVVIAGSEDDDETS